MTDEDKKEFEEFLEWKKQKEAEQLKAEQQKAEEQKVEEQKAEPKEAEQSASTTPSTPLLNKESEGKKEVAEKSVSNPQREDKANNFGIKVAFGSLAIVIIFIFVCIKCSNQDSTAYSSDVDTASVDTTEVKEKEETTTSKIGPKYDWWVQAQYANADYDYKSITNGQRFAIEDGVTLIDDMIDNVNKLEGIINDDEYQISQFPDFYESPKMAEKLKRNHKAAEKELKKRLPQYRKYYVKTASQILWKHDMKVRSSGTTIWFIGAVFARNANIEEFHNDQAEKLRTLGFKKACYKWVDADVEYTYYNL